MQQLPTLLGQQYWELLHPFWHWCVNGCRNSQQCIMGRIQLIRLCKPFVICMRGPINVGKSCANGSNIVALLLKRSRNKRNVGSFWLKSLTSFKLCTTTPNIMQQGVQMDTTCNIQHWMGA